MKSILALGYPDLRWPPSGSGPKLFRRFPKPIFLLATRGIHAHLDSISAYILEHKYGVFQVLSAPCSGIQLFLAFSAGGEISGESRYI